LQDQTSIHSIGLITQGAAFFEGLRANVFAPHKSHLFLFIVFYEKASLKKWHEKPKEMKDASSKPPRKTNKNSL